MDAWPELDIYFPQDKEADLVEEMKRQADGRWTWKDTDPFDRLAVEGSYFFHREEDDTGPACTICVARKEYGHLFVSNVTPDEMGSIPHDTIVAITNDFDSHIASPAAHSVEGMTSVGTAQHTLEDYFSPRAIELLEYFCTSSNGYGSHPSDQRKWRAFLLEVYRNNEKIVHCDVFGGLLKSKNWWPEDGIRELVGEYDFAMQLLEQADKG